MSQQFVVCEAAALDEREGAGSAKGAGGVGASSVDGLELDVAHAAEKDVRLLKLKGSKRAADGVLGPALRVRFLRVFKEAVEGPEQFGRHVGESKRASQVGGLGHDEVVFVRQCFAERFSAGFLRGIAECIEGGELCFECLLAGHDESVPWHRG